MNNTNLEIKIISYNSDEYQQAIQLRYKILREPLGLQFSAGDLYQDENEIIIGLFHSEQIIGILQLRPLNPKTVKFRQMAVDRAHQHKGYGSKLIEFAEKIAQKKKFHKVILHARESAVGFYKKSGYKIEGTKFMEVGISHFKMCKKL